MKSIVDYIKVAKMSEERYQHLHRGYIISEEDYLDNLTYKELNESNYQSQHIFQNASTKNKKTFYEDIQAWPQSKYDEWINGIIKENLKSTSIEKFCAALEKKFIKDMTDVEIVDPSNDTIENSSAICVKFKKENMIDDNLEELLNICEFHRYYITNVLKYQIYFEHLDTEEVTNTIKTKFGNKVYRFIKNETVKSVENNGLIVYGKSGRSITDPIYYLSTKDYKDMLAEQSKNTLRNRLQRVTTYRMFPNRVFVYYTDIDPKEAAIQLGKSIKRDFDINDYSVVEVDLKHHKIPFFRDSMMNNYNKHIQSAYSNIDIPPNLITSITSLKS